MAADLGVQKTSQISASLEGVVAPADAGRTAPTAAWADADAGGRRPRRARRGLRVAYVIADAIAPLPPVSAPRWFLALVARDRAVRLARRLHGLQPLRQRQPADLGLELRRGARPLPRDARRLARLPDPLAGRRRTSSAGGSTRRSRRCSSSPPRSSLVPVVARLDPQLGLPARDEAAAHADRRQRRRGAPRLPQAQGASRVRPRGRRLPRRRRASSRCPGRCSARPTDVARVVDEYEIDRVLLASSVGEPRGDARPRAHRAPARRAGLDRAALLRDLHLARDRSTTSRACRS